jgi:signal peptidase II
MPGCTGETLLNSILPNPDKPGYLKLTVIAGLVVIFDQAAKFVILKTLALYHFVTVIPGFFDITHIQNPGGAFGFLSNQSYLLFL